MENTSITRRTRVSPQKQGASTATLLFGIWLMVAAFIFATTPEGKWNSLVIGILLLACSALRLRKNSSFLWSCANVIFGFWMLLGPQPLIYKNTPFRWSDFALGWATVALSIMGATGHDRVADDDTDFVDHNAIPIHRRFA